jgi:phospholipase/carboxylesterase
MTFPAIDSTAVRWSLPRDEVASALADRPLLIMMHGYGSHEGDLFSLAQYLPEQFVTAALRGPLRAGQGYAWFDLQFNPATNTLQRDVGEVNASAEALLAWIDELETEVGGLGQIALLGFSQGGVMLSQLLRHAPECFDAGVLLSGFIVEDSTPGAAERDARLAEVKPPVFWGRDAEDPVIGQELVDVTRRWLPAHTNLTTKLYSYMGHGITMEEVDDVRSFLTEHVL